MAQSSCHLKPFIPQDILSRNGSRKCLPESWSISGWDEGIAEKRWEKILRHRESQDGSSGTEGVDIESSKQAHDEKIKKKKEDN